LGRILMKPTNGGQSNEAKAAFSGGLPLGSLTYPGWLIQGTQ
jgi:hypothetical protein